MSMDTPRPAADELVTAEAITLRIMTAKGLDARDARLRAAIHVQAGAVLNRLVPAEQSPRHTSCRCGVILLLLPRTRTGTLQPHKLLQRIEPERCAEQCCYRRDQPTQDHSPCLIRGISW